MCRILYYWTCTDIAFFPPFFLFQCLNKYQSFALSRKRDQPQVVHPQRSAPIISWQLLPIHRLSDHTTLQQGGGVDHLLQACVSVPFTGVFSPHTHTHTKQYPARSHWITCCPTVLMQKKFFSSSASTLHFSLIISAITPMHTKPKRPIYNRLLSRRGSQLLTSDWTY